MFYELIRPLLFAMTAKDAEDAHSMMLYWAKRAQGSPAVLSLISAWYDANRNPRPAEVCGIRFPNRVGLAAGFDKNAAILPFVQALGFGFIEAGTVLPYEQGGNERPRLFRIPEYEVIINRMGFNSEGAQQVKRNLDQYSLRLRVPLLLSLGKMKDTPLGDAARDYQKALRWVQPHGDAYVINVSSPNTPGLRELQHKQYIEELVRLVVHEAGRKPVFVKIAPDLTEAEAEETLGAVKAGGASGLIINNTTVRRDFFAHPFPSHAKEQGGLSGTPLFSLMISLLRQVRRLDAHIPIIAVGGIDCAERGRQAFDEGADLLQIYTGFIYHGPHLVRQLRSVQ